MKAITLAFLLSGCENGVVMTDAETLACRDVGCVVFTEAEVRSLVGRAINEGFHRGWADAVKQGSKGL